jgi:hypothetical protein
MHFIPAKPEATRVDFNGPYALTIGGELVETNSSFEVYNPATNAILARAPEATPPISKPQSPAPNRRLNPGRRSAGTSAGTISPATRTRLRPIRRS